MLIWIKRYLRLNWPYFPVFLHCIECVFGEYHRRFVWVPLMVNLTTNLNPSKKTINTQLECIFFLLPEHQRKIHGVAHLILLHVPFSILNYMLICII